MAGILYVALVAVGFGTFQSSESETVSGVVYHAASGHPIVGASVVLEDADRETFSAWTDAEGEFAITEVTPGRYSLQVNANGYSRPAGGGWPSELVVVPGGGVRELPIYMVETGVITGRVLAPEGRPTSGLFVQAVRPNADGELEIVKATSTDDRGRYRLFFLPPGDYYVRAQLGPTQNFIRSDSGGLTYFPGVLDVELADEVRVAEGTEAVGVDFSVRSSVNYRIAGTIRMPATADLFVRLFLARNVPGIRDAPTPPMTPHFSGSEFEIPGVQQGAYDLFAFVPDAEGAIYYGHTQLSVAGQDVTGLDVVLEPTTDLDARLRRIGESGPSINSPLRLTLERRGPLPSMLLPPGVTVDLDGRFSLPAVVPGTYDVILSEPSASDVYAEAVYLGETDISVSGLTVPGDAAGMALDLGVRLRAGGSIEGVAQTPGQAPASYAEIVLVPFSVAGPGFASRQRVVEADAFGEFAIRGVPPGEYGLFTIGVIEELSRTPNLDPRDSGRGVPVAMPEPGSRVTGIVVPLSPD